MRGFNYTVEHHARRQFMVGVAHTNAIEGLWATLKRWNMGTYRRLSARHWGGMRRKLPRQQYDWADIADQVRQLMRRMGEKRLRYADLVA